MSKMGMPETAKNATRNQSKQQKIQMILQFERQFEGNNRKNAPKKSKYADVNDHFLERKFEGINIVIFQSKTNFFTYTNLFFRIFECGSNTYYETCKYETITKGEKN